MKRGRGVRSPGVTGVCQLWLCSVGTELCPPEREEITLNCSANSPTPQSVVILHTYLCSISVLDSWLADSSNSNNECFHHWKCMPNDWQKTEPGRNFWTVWSMESRGLKGCCLCATLPNITGHLFFVYFFLSPDKTQDLVQERQFLY